MHPGNHLTRAAVLFALACLSASAFGQAFEPFVIEDIRVEGLVRISEGTVFNYLPIAPGDELNERRAQNAVRALTDTGFFNDVRVEVENNVFILIVEERPAIATIEFEGNKAIKTEALLESLAEIGFARGEIYNEAILDRLTQDMQRQYFAQGKYGMTVDPQVIPLPGNRVAVRVVISEGDVTKIKLINIVGNDAFKERRLLKLLELKKTNLFSLFTRSNQYSDERLYADFETLTSFYRDNGYINFRIDSPQVSITPDKKDIYITLNITEGERYVISDVKLAGNLIISEEQLFPYVLTREEMVFSQRRITDTEQYIADRLGVEGYAFANVNTLWEVDEEDNTVALTYVVDPQQRVYVRRINFTGNAATRDEVLRREMRQLEGGWMSTAAVERSKVRLQRLGFFEEVNVETPAVPGSTDQVDVNYTVEEQPSGNLMVSVAYSDYEGFIVSANISQQNFLGSGKSVGIGFQNSSINRYLQLQYVNPYWTIDGISRGFNLRYQEIDQSSLGVTAYHSRVLGGSTEFGIPISEYNFVTTSIGYEATKLDPGFFQVSDEVQDFIDREGNKFNTLKLSAGFAYDTLNSGLFPDRGVYQRVTVQAAVPGGDLYYYRLGYDGQIFIPLGADFTLKFKGTVGYGAAYGKTEKYPFFENFYAGGTQSVRGYRDYSLGPQDIYGNSLGGTLKIVGNAELIIPLAQWLDVRSFQVAAFYDVGNVFAAGERVALSQMRMSAGVSLVWLSPFGLFQIGYGIPFHFQPGDETKKFHFSIGTSF